MAVVSQTDQTERRRPRASGPMPSLRAPPAFGCRVGGGEGGGGGRVKGEKKAKGEDKKGFQVEGKYGHNLKQQGP